MNITTAKYVKDKYGENSCIMATIDGEELAIPLYVGNRHYDAILEWVADGNLDSSSVTWPTEPS